MKKIIWGIALLFSTSMVAGAHTCCHNSAQKCGCKRGYYTQYYGDKPELIKEAIAWTESGIWPCWLRAACRSWRLSCCRLSKTVPPTSGTSTRSAAPSAAQKGFHPRCRSCCACILLPCLSAGSMGRCAVIMQHAAFALVSGPVLCYGKR